MDKFNLEDVSNENVNWNSKSTTDVIDFIALNHHDYMKVELPRVTKLSYTIRRVHGNTHPELFEIEETFKGLNDKIEEYIAKEEDMFAYIKEMGKDISNNVKEVIEGLKADQGEIKETFNLLKNKTNDYCAPEDGCQTYDLTYSLYKELEEVVNHQFDIENKYLFTKLI